VSIITSENSTSELKAHINGALNVGCSRQEIREIIIHLAVYTGFPSAINAMFAAQEVFAKRDKNGES
jgi:4-carboxymuconolactone decarboxylase